MGRRPIFTSEQELAMAVAALEGMPMSEVAAHMRCSESSAYRIVRQNKAKAYEKHPELLPKHRGVDAKTLMEHAKTTRLNAVETAFGDETQIFDLNTTVGKTSDRRQTALADKFLKTQELPSESVHIETISELYGVYKEINRQTVQTLQNWLDRCKYISPEGEVEGECICEWCIKRREGFWNPKEDGTANSVKSPLTNSSVERVRDTNTSVQDFEPREKLTPLEEEYYARADDGQSIGGLKRWLDDEKFREVIRNKPEYADFNMERWKEEVDD